MSESTDLDHADIPSVNNIAQEVAETIDTTPLRATFSGKTSCPSPFSQSDLPPTDSSPLLASTPPTVSRALIKAYPYLLFANRLLSVVTWTNEDIWLSILMVLAYNALVVYYEPLVTYVGHLLLVGIVALYTVAYRQVTLQAQQRPTLDDVIFVLNTVTVRADMLLSPITSLSLTSEDLKRLLFTTIFLTPMYIVLTFFFVNPQMLLLLSGNFVLTYHSHFSRVGRKIAWKSRTVRVLCFYLTGLNFNAHNPHHRASQLFASAVAKVTKSESTGAKPVRFTYVLYENQRRWLGIGWTSNLLSYERTAWTDEFLNESVATDEFQLPETNASARAPDTMYWRWVDKTWRLDLTNDGGLQLPRSRSKTTPDPGPDEGWIFSDNTWKKPGTEDSFGKYTRRRRWIRTAELVPIGGSATTVVTGAADTSHNMSSPETQKVSVVGELNTEVKKKKKTLRFDFEEPKPSILESVKILEEQSAREEQLIASGVTSSAQRRASSGSVRSVSFGEDSVPKDETVDENSKDK